MKNNLIRGIRKASDFLMALQLTGAFKKLVAGEPAGAPAGSRHRRRTDRDRYGHGAVRVLPVQVEKILERYETLSAEFGEAVVRGAL